MFIAELTTYGQSVVSSQVTIDGIILISEYVSNINSADLSQAVLDIDACGSINRSNGSVRIIDASSNVYTVRTILFYTLSGSTKKVVAGYSQEESFLLKTSSVLNILLPFDFSVFTNGFLFATVQSGYSNAAHNTDGVLHIDNPDTNADDNYSVYSKTQVDDLISDVSYTAGDGISLSNNTIKTTGIPFGICDSTSTATAFTVTVPGIYKLEDGVCCMVKNGVVTSASGFTLNVNGLGGKPCYTNLAAATRDTTIFNVSYTMLFVYDSTRVSGGCWICYRGYDANTNTIGYQLRTNSTVMTVTDTARYYKLYFTSADGNHWVPASINSTNNATTARAVNQRPIDPFGRIVYTSANTSYAAGANLAATTIWDQYAIALGYSFNVNGGDLTLTTKTPVYVKCAPQSDGSAIMDATTPIVQTLPSSADGKIYILLGVAYDAIHIELVINHPVYYHDGSGIKLWTGSVIPSKTTDLVNDAGFITEDDIPTNVSAFTNDTGYLTSFTETDPTVPNWAKQTNKPIYTLDEVSDGSTRKLSNYELKSNLKEGAYINVDETTMTSTSTNLPTSKAVASYISGLGYITTESDPTVPSWAKQSSKPSYTLDEVSDGSTRKLSNYVPTSRKVNNKALSSDVTLTLDDVADGTNRKIPTVNNATLTIQKNGTTVNTFTANASSNVTANIIVPTDTGDLTNNAGFITSADMSNFVTTNTVQTITAAKTFDNDITVTDGNNIILNYSDEAIPDDAQAAPADNYAQLFTTTRDELETSGGAVKVPDVVLDLGPYYYTDDTVSSADGAPSFSIVRGNTEVARFASYAYVNKLGSPYDFVSEAYITQIGSHFYPSTAIYATTFYGNLDGNASSATSATNATYAKYLSNAKLVDGVTFSNDSNIAHYTTCSTGASTVAKEASLTGFTLVEGARVAIKFSATNSASNPTLNVNNTGAKAIKYRGTSAVTSSNWYRWQAGDIIDFIYDGTNWLMVGWQTYTTNASVASYTTYVGNSSANYVAYSNNAASNGKALLPYADASDSTKYVDLGSTAKKWRDLYLYDKAYLGPDSNIWISCNYQSSNSTLDIVTQVDTGDTAKGIQNSEIELEPNYFRVMFSNNYENNYPFYIQKYESGIGSRIFFDTDYLFLENGTRINFEYQSGSMASLSRVANRTITANNEQVTVPDLKLELRNENSRFIISGVWSQIAYFDSNGLTFNGSKTISDGTNTYSLPSSSGTLALTSDLDGIFCIGSNDSLGSNSIQSGYDYRPAPSGSLTDSPKWRGNDVSIYVSQYINFVDNNRISVYVPEHTYIGSIAFLYSQGASKYAAYPVYFRGQGSAHNATAPAGSILRLTFRQNAFHTDFYDLADFGVEHEPIVRVGKVPHTRDISGYHGTLVGVGQDGKFDTLLSISVDTECAGFWLSIYESLKSCAPGSPIYASFQGECFSAYPRVPFGFVTNLEYVYDYYDVIDYDKLKFVYVENGSVVQSSSVLESHVVTNPKNSERYFHINNAPVYLIYSGYSVSNRVYISIGGLPSDTTGKLIGFLPASADDAGLFRLVNCKLDSYATTATNLESAPSLSWSNATSASAGSTLTVTAGGKTSTATTITTVRRAYNSYIGTYSTSGSYPLVFSLNTTAGFKQLYTDADNSLYYNPNSNTLTCTNFSGSLSGTASKATADASGNTITSYYCTLSTNQTISGTKTFSGTTKATGDVYITGYSSGGLRFADSDNLQTTDYVRVRGNCSGSSYSGIDFQFYVSSSLKATFGLKCDSSGVLSSSGMANVLCGTGIGAVYLLLVKITNNSSSTVSISRGNLLNNSNLTIGTLYIASLHAEYTSSLTPSSLSNAVGAYYYSSTSTSAGSFKLLSSLYVPGSASRYYVILAVRAA